MTDFNSWLINRPCTKDTAFLQIRVLIDPDFPPATNSWRDCQNYFVEKNAPSSIVETFESLWGEYWQTGEGETCAALRIKTT